MRLTATFLRALIAIVPLAAAGCDRTPAEAPKPPAPTPVAAPVPARSPIASAPTKPLPVVRVLDTENYLVTIDDSRPAEDFASTAITYHCVAKKSGHRIKLKGGTCLTEIADGRPEKFVGYSFLNGDTQYVVWDDGTLEVSRGYKLLVDEKGSWRKSPADKRS